MIFLLFIFGKDVSSNMETGFFWHFYIPVPAKIWHKQQEHDDEFFKHNMYRKGATIPSFVQTNPQGQIKSAVNMERSGM